MRSIFLFLLVLKVRKFASLNLSVVLFSNVFVSPMIPFSSMKLKVVLKFLKAIDVFRELYFREFKSSPTIKS